MFFTKRNKKKTRLEEDLTKAFALNDQQVSCVVDLMAKNKVFKEHIFNQLIERFGKK